MELNKQAQEFSDSFAPFKDVQGYDYRHNAVFPCDKCKTEARVTNGLVDKRTVHIHIDENDNVAGCTFFPTSVFLCKSCYLTELMRLQNPEEEGE